MPPFKQALKKDGIPFTSFEVDNIEREFNRLQSLNVEFTKNRRQQAKSSLPCLMIRAETLSFLSEPAVLLGGTSEEQAKFYLQDTSHNVIEVKAYRNLADTLGTDGN